MLKPALIAGAVFASLYAYADDNIGEIPFVGSSIEVDGSLDDPSWKQARKITINNVTWPYENKQSPVQTTAYVYEDGEVLYIGFDAKDTDPDAIRAFYQDRDKSWNDDMVGIKIDSYNSSQLAYQFFVNPLGVQTDSIENELTKHESASWDGIWDSAGQIHESGYTVEMAIPLRVLNFDDSLKQKVMAMEFVRFLPRSERLRLSSMKINHGNNCWICQMPSYKGFEKAEQGNNIAIIPSLVVADEHTREIDEGVAPDWENNRSTEPGLDVKWGITPDITLNATLNPDFSQVEADVAQLNVNDNFSLFFPEKRAFFLDNADYFASSLNLIHTRNVAEPDYGAKLTGSKAGHTFATFVANDTQTTVLIPGNLGSSLVSLERKSDNLAARYRFDASSDLSIGATVTSRSSEGYENQVYSVDTKYKATVNDTLNVQFIGSRTDYDQAFVDELCNEDSCESPETIECNRTEDCAFNEGVLRVYGDDTLSDTGYYINYQHDEKHWRGFATYHDRGRDLRADMGFLTQVDFKKFVAGGEYRWYGNETSWWNHAAWYTDWDITHNDNGELLEKELETSFRLNGPLQSFIKLGLMTRQRAGLRNDASSLSIDDNTDLFSENGIDGYMEIKPKAGVLAGLGFYRGNSIDIANNRLGDLVRLSPIFNINLSKHLELKLRHTFERLEADGADVYTARLTDARLTYQFNVNSFLRLAVIYTDLERNQANYLESVDSHYKQLSTQLLYSYKLNPQTVFFAGYSDNGYRDDSLNTLTKDQRTLFAKFSYAWLM